MRTITEFSALHGISPNLMHQFIWRHKVPTIKGKREVTGNAGGSYIRSVNLLPPESEAWILENNRRIGRIKAFNVKYDNPLSRTIREFERYLVASFRKLKGQATTEQIVVGCMEEFRRGCGVG